MKIPRHANKRGRNPHGGKFGSPIPYTPPKRRDSKPIV